ncbi:cytochrome P450 [Lentinula aff. lateritia]|uniref:Cytochrome P450 n=1 Tax=Lentinula aff. lateritia TaxID=2804960 RepID=A0ACC1TVZ5_9AGAR|nr:cytochrome P450 [Lentinula aff. lateritia]
MALPLYIYTLFGLVPFFALVRWKAYRTLRKAAPSPPGPPGLPFLGTVSMLWERKPWLRFMEWKVVYGPVVQLKILGKTIVVLNTHEAAFDLLCCRNKIYNGRPRSILISEMMTGGLAFPLVDYGELWKGHRRAAQTVLSPHAVEQYHDNQERHSERLVQSLLQDSEAWSEHVRDSLYSLFCSVGYGDANKDKASYHIRKFIGRIVHAAIPGSAVTDFFPFLARFPGWLLPSKGRHLAQFQADNEDFVRLVSQLQLDMPGEDSMTTNLLENRGTNQMMLREIAWLIAVLCAIGGEVACTFQLLFPRIVPYPISGLISIQTSSVLPVFVLAMALYPAVQQRAQEEIDSVVGKGRFPTFQDRNKLPYVQAIVREVLRWRPIGPIGFPRCCLQTENLQDDIYKGYLIQAVKAGSIVVPNIWAMNRDPHLYRDCDKFYPERFLDFKGDVPGALGQGHVSYGFGDRICSGMHIADDALFINIAAILHACDIRESPDSPLAKDVFEDFGIVTISGGLDPSHVKSQHAVQLFRPMFPTLP